MSKRKDNSTNIRPGTTPSGRQSRSAQPKPTLEADRERSKADAIFKELLNQATREVGLVNGPTELRVQDLSTSDLLLLIPPGLLLQDTLFDFFRLVNVLEFKSMSDPLDIFKFAIQIGRVEFWLAKNPNYDYSQVLNVIISARYPRELLNYAKERGCPFKPIPGRNWLLQAPYGFQDVVIVLCNELPLEPRYYPWLLFASETKTWEKFVLRLGQEGRYDLLQTAQRLRPKEFEMNYQKIVEMIEAGELDPREKARIEEEKVEATGMALEWMSRRRPNQIPQVLAYLKPEERLSGLKPEERLSGLKPEERQALLKLLSEQNPKDGEK